MTTDSQVNIKGCLIRPPSAHFLWLCKRLKNNFRYYIESTDDSQILRRLVGLHTLIFQVLITTNPTRGRAEIVGQNILTEYLPGNLITREQRRAREADMAGVRQCVALVQGRVLYWV